MQLDIFQDSHDVMLRNAVIDALERRDAAAARAAHDRLQGDYPADECLPALGGLIDGLESLAQASIHDHESLRQARATVESLQAGAERIFGRPAAPRWQAPLWAELARRAAGLAYRGDTPLDHAAPLWLKAGDWQAAARAVEGIASWRRIPAPLAWMTEARLHLLGLQATWPLVAELGWLAPERLDRLLRHAGDPLLSTLARRFGENFEGEGGPADAAWFAAWVLIERPEVAAHAAAAQASQHSAPERAFRTLVELLGLERQGRQQDLVQRRKALRDLHPSLYAQYMSSR